MGRFIDKECNFAIYNVPKGGGTTIRSWIYFVNTGELALRNQGDGYINQAPKTYSYLRKIGYEVCNFIPWSKGPSICIVRNPINRFISLYLDKIVKEKRCGNPPPSFSDFTCNFARFIKDNDFPHGANRNLNFLEHHFASQSLILGKDEDYYEHIFDISEMNTKVKSYLEKRWGVELPSLHCRKAKKNSEIIPNPKDLKHIEEIYKIDLSCNWICMGL